QGWWEGERSGGERAFAGDTGEGQSWRAPSVWLRFGGRWGAGSLPPWPGVCGEEAGMSPFMVSVAHPAMPCGPKGHTHSSARQSPRGMLVVLGVKPALVR